MFPTPTPVPPGYVDKLINALAQSGETAAAFQNNLAGAVILLVGIMTVALIVLLIFLWKMTGGGRRASKETESQEAQADKITAETFNQAFITMSNVLSKADARDERNELLRREENEKRIENSVITNDILNKISDNLVELKNQQKYGNEQDIKRDLLLAAFKDDIGKIAADTPLLPHLSDIKTTLSDIKNTMMTMDGMQSICNRLDALQRLVEMDAQEWIERLDSAKRIAAAVENRPVVEDIPDEAQP